MATFDPWTAAQAHIAAMSPAAQAKAIEFTHNQHWMLLWGALASLAVWLIILWTGVLRRTRDAMEKNGPKPVLTSMAVSRWRPSMSAVLSLPWGIYANWYVQKSFGMTTQPLDGWLVENLIGSVIAVIGGVIFFALFYLLLRRAPKSWPIWGGVLVALFFGVALILQPIFIEPLFNKYTPAPQGPMRDAIVTLAKQTGTRCRTRSSSTTAPNSRPITPPMSRACSAPPAWRSAT